MCRNCDEKGLIVDTSGLQVHQFDFCAAGGASGEANNEAVFKLAGIRPGEVWRPWCINAHGLESYSAGDSPSRVLTTGVGCEEHWMLERHCGPLQGIF